MSIRTFPEQVFTTSSGVKYTPFIEHGPHPTVGFVVEYAGKPTEYVYLHPSDDAGGPGDLDESPDVFVLSGLSVDPYTSRSECLIPVLCNHHACRK